MADQYTGFNGRLAALMTNKVGTMSAFYVATIFQLGWIGLAQAGIIRFDPYPFSFLLFLSSLTQLLLMFVLMVGQQVIGRTADQRALQTYLDAEAVLHACERLQAHLRAQDLAIRHVVDHMNECRPHRSLSPPDEQIPLWHLGRGHTSGKASPHAGRNRIDGLHSGRVLALRTRSDDGERDRRPRGDSLRRADHRHA